MESTQNETLFEMHFESWEVYECCKNSKIYERLPCKKGNGTNNNRQTTQPKHQILFRNEIETVK